MSMNNDGQMIFGDLGGLKLPDICLTGEEKLWKNLTQETCPDRGSNPGLLRDKRACYHLLHIGGRNGWRMRCDVGEVTTHSPTLPSLYICHSSFSNPSVASPTSQFILQPFFRFSYVTSSSLNSPGEPPMGLILGVGGVEIFLYSFVSTQPPIEWVPGAFPGRA